MSLRKDGTRLSVRVAKALLKRIDTLAKKLGVGRSVTIRLAIEAGLDKLEEKDND